MINKTTRSLIGIWLGWFIILYGFQWVVTARLGVLRPDLAVSWSRTETAANSNRGKIYLLEPFMNRQVAWDSEYYVGIAVGGYDDPAGGKVSSTASGEPINKNYSFFPLYPWVMKGISPLLALFGLNPIAAATAAGIVVTLLGTLAGMVALYHLTQDLFDGETGYRAVVYMLIFPTAFFFAMVYTEGLFVGLAFWSLLLSKRKQWVWASLLGLLAALTRAHGAALLLPLLYYWVQRREENAAAQNWRWWVQGAAAFLPLVGYALWRISPLGQGWAELQPFYFGRGFLSLGRTLGDMRNVYEYAQSNSQAAVYFSLEAAAILLALVASFWLLRRDFPVAIFGLTVILLSLFSGSAQSMARYMLISPPLYIFLAHLGRHKVFDRTWSLASILLLGMLAMLFAFDMWVG
ncbi:MAG: hypothetical protein KJ063_20200 [Anaerolineae bacterium]|nr:hypothetical protein [Anaerolineae bacterium]